MIGTKTMLPGKNLKIRLSSKRVEPDHETAKSEFRERVSRVDEGGYCNPKEKSCVSGSIKRGPQGSIEGHKTKRQKMDRRASAQCATILKSLTSHTYSWVFNKPVDPVALNIPDYYTVISCPMDLGTIKSKLEKNIYFGIEEFAADVRLTFSNAMTYNPPSHNVHLMAKELKNIFEKEWKDLEKKQKYEHQHGKSMTETVMESDRKYCNGTHLPRKDTLPKKLQVPELKRIQKTGSLAGRHAKVEVSRSSQIPCKLVGKDLCKGNDNHNGRHPSAGSEEACSKSGLASCKCSMFGDILCHCVIDSDPTHASSDIPSVGSEGRNQHVCGADALRLDGQAHSKSPLQRKINFDSKGAVSDLDGEHVCSSFHLSNPAMGASSGEVRSSPALDVQLSPKKALRAAMLKSRFADTILKAQQKTLLIHSDKSYLLKTQQEKERLERMQHEESARIEAQIKSAEVAARIKAEKEFNQRRDKKREAARIAIQKMVRTVDIENGLEILEELGMLCGDKLSYPARRNNILELLGLFIKDEYSASDEYEVLKGMEDGEILS